MSTEIETTETPKLAELHEAILDAETLGRLFRDLELCTTVIEIVPRAARHQMVVEPSLTLEEARNKILNGTLSGAQIRYQYEGADWWDTLIRTPQGVRIVRIRHDFQPPPGAAS